MPRDRGIPGARNLERKKNDREERAKWSAKPLPRGDELLEDDEDADATLSIDQLLAKSVQRVSAINEDTIRANLQKKLKKKESGTKRRGNGQN
mmetsp:Transcript_28572/g.56155  ORF Transcript_28572/g.56155 Transcript_28572/m.56155 type:complete len:93 (-) Transcript_28572:517-795(-)